jgi:hypothetical protein
MQARIKAALVKLCLRQLYRYFSETLKRIERGCYMRITSRSNAVTYKSDVFWSVFLRLILSHSIRCAALFWIGVFLMFSVGVAPAQIRLHDAANDELAKKTREAFTEFSKSDANVFETMISNTLAVKKATLIQLQELSRQSVRAKVNIIPILTWEKLVEKVIETQDDFLTAYNAAQLILDQNNVNAKDFKSAIAAAREKSEALKKAKAEIEAKLKNEEAPKLENLKGTLEKLRDAVAASEKPVTKLSDLAEYKSLKDVWSNIQAVKSWFDAANQASNAPGLQLTILDLAVQHQQFEVERLQLQIEEAAAKSRIAERMTQRLSLVWGDGTIDSNTGRLKQGLFGQIYTNILPCSPGPICANPFVTDQTKSQQVLETVGKLSTSANGEVGTPIKSTMQLRNLLDILGRYVTLTGYQMYLLLADTIEAGTDTHLFSIRRSALNTKDREMLISHGLDGLAAYHSGGLKPEDIANFFRAAQSIAIGVIAGRGK